MEEMLTKLVENTPVLAVLAIYILYSAKSQDKRNGEAAQERQQFLESYKQVADSLSKLAVQIENQCDHMQNFAEGVMQAHQYQKMEHEQLIKLLTNMTSAK